MKTNRTNPRPALSFLSKAGTAWLAAFMLLTLPVAGFTQEITGSVRGTVLTPSGSPAAGESVTVTDTRTGSSRTVTTNDSGSFNVRGLTVGGPYEVRVISSQYQGARITDVFTNLSGATSLNISLEAADQAIEEIVVLASAVSGTDVAIGPSSTFSLEQIEALPTIGRQVRDVVRLDPRVGVGRANDGSGFGISCLGGSNKHNSFTIDGVRSADGFGLNASGNGSRTVFPIPFDTVRSAAVQFAPIDVQYGAFTGCNVNVVTKSGANDFAGSIFYLINDEGLTGDTLLGEKVVTDPFEDTNWGVEFSGPIIRDTLFFYAAYEETDGGAVQNDGPVGAGFANEGDLTLAEAETIRGILTSQYGRENLEIVRNLPQTSERIFGRLDWNINDEHRLEATYVKLEEFNLDGDDFGFGGFTFSDNFEIEGAEQERYGVRLFSNWTDRFSTEFRLSTLDHVDIQGPLGGGEAQESNIPRIEVEDGNGDVILTSGPGFFRSANDLQYTLDQFKLAGDYVLGDHTLTVGYELDRLDVFNLFIRDATGTITFATTADLQTGLASGIVGNGSFTGDPRDAGATFKRDINTFYIQDEWQASDRLVVTAGLRYDDYKSDDRPIDNPVFAQRYGFSNSTGFDGLNVLMPRLGLTYDMPWDTLGELQVRAGFGVFTGGDPTVHFANSFQGFGGGIGSGSSAAAPCVAADLQVLDAGGAFTGIPACIGQQQIASALANTGVVEAIHPDFELPEQHRWNLGFTLSSESDIGFFDNWNVEFDYIYSDHKNSIEFLDLTLTQNVDATGALVFLPDGRKQFNAIDPLLAGCNATFDGPGLGFSNVTSACDSGGDDQDILMTNGIEGTTTSISFQLARNFDFTDRTSLDLRFGYAYTDAEIGNPVNSSTASSGFEEVATAELNNNVLAPAQYANEHNFVLGTTFNHYFFENHPTKIGIFFRRRSGRPFSYAYDSGRNDQQAVFGDSDDEERNLFYVPTGPSDPLVDLSALDAAGTTDDFFLFLDQSGLNRFAGQVSGRNAFEQDWSSDLDIRIQQDVPLPFANHSFKLFLDIENVLNMFSDGDNLQRFADTGDVSEAVPVLDVRLSADGSQYVYRGFNPGGAKQANFDSSELDVDDSLWRIQLGFRYQFGQ